MSLLINRLLCKISLVILLFLGNFSTFGMLCLYREMAGKVKFSGVKKELDGSVQNNIKLLKHSCFKEDGFVVQGMLFTNDFYKQLPPYILFTIKKTTGVEDDTHAIELYHTILRPKAGYLIYEQAKNVKLVEMICDDQEDKLDQLLNDPDAKDWQISPQVYDCRIASFRMQTAKRKMIDMHLAFNMFDYPTVIKIAQCNKQIVPFYCNLNSLTCVIN